MTTVEHLAVCFHESGHCVCLLHFGIAFEYVTVLPEPAPSEHSDAVHSLPQRTKPLWQAACCLAGAAAETKFTGEPVRALFENSARTDFTKALDALVCDGTSLPACQAF